MFHPVVELHCSREHCARYVFPFIKKKKKKDSVAAALADRVFSAVGLFWI